LDACRDCQPAIAAALGKAPNPADIFRHGARRREITPRDYADETDGCLSMVVGWQRQRAGRLQQSAFLSASSTAGNRTAVSASSKV